MNKYLRKNREDLEYLLFVGLPGGILMMLLFKGLSYINLF
jgi:hypothetical protein